MMIRNDFAEPREYQLWSVELKDTYWKVWVPWVCICIGLIGLSVLIFVMIRRCRKSESIGNSPPFDQKVQNVSFTKTHMFLKQDSPSIARQKLSRVGDDSCWYKEDVMCLNHFQKQLRSWLWKEDSRNWD
jgi:hypothetical protein